MEKTLSFRSSRVTLCRTKTSVPKESQRSGYGLQGSESLMLRPTVTSFPKEARSKQNGEDATNPTQSEGRVTTMRLRANTRLGTSLLEYLTFLFLYL